MSSRVAVPVCIPGVGVRVTVAPHQHLLLSVSWAFFCFSSNHSNGCGHTPLRFNLHFLHILFAIHVSSLVKCLFKPFAHF